MQALITCDTESQASPRLLGVPRPRREKDATDAKPLPARALYSLCECERLLGVERGSIVVVWSLPVRTGGDARMASARRCVSFPRRVPFLLPLGSSFHAFPSWSPFSDVDVAFRVPYRVLRCAGGLVSMADDLRRGPRRLVP